MAVLPDLLVPGLTTVFCGSAAGAVSARRGLPYAGPGNKFWPTPAATGLTPRLFPPDDYRALLDLGIGLTDVNKTQSGADSDLTADGDDPAVLIAKIERHRPRLLAFTAKRPAQVVMRHAFARDTIAYGLQDERVGDTAVFVLPSPSGLAIRWWDPAWWHRAADLHRSLAAERANMESGVSNPAR
jgi:TDG/mug DNA glycosylase family protein